MKMKMLLCLFILISGFAVAQTKLPSLAYQLTHTDTGEPFPSPDGKQLLYESQIAGFYQLFIMNVDGSGQKQITHDPTNHDLPSWSPDGKRIAYDSDRNGHSVIYVMDLDGSNEQRVSPENGESINPMWSPDSKQIIYCADDDLKPPKKNDASIYVFDLETKRTTTLITGGVNTYPTYSPDGTKVAFRKMIGDMNSEVFVADADGKNVRNLSNHQAFDGWPAWSPDGKLIAFSSNRRSNYQIHIMDADGSNVHLVANTEGRATEPRWSVDGKRIYFTNCKKVDFGTDCQIMTVPVDGTAIR